MRKKDFEGPSELTIRSSTDYKEFKFSSINRDIVNTTVAKLIAENRSHFNMPYYPVVVNSNNEIIDGQHRFLACKISGWPVYYVKKEVGKIKPVDIFTVNRAGRRHTSKDRLTIISKTKTIAGKKALEILSFHDLYKQYIGLDVLLRLAHRGSGNSYTKIESMEFKAVDLALVEKILKAFINSDIESFVWARRVFLLPVARIYCNYEIELKDIIVYLRDNLEYIFETPLSEKEMSSFLTLGLCEG